jgi:hypothetical protein
MGRTIREGVWNQAPMIAGFDFGAPVMLRFKGEEQQ